MPFTECRHALAGLVFIAFMAACSDTTEPDPTIPTAGRVRVTAATSGLDPDGDGYFVTVDNRVRHALGSNGSITLSAVPAGTREVRLDGVATNCTAGNGATRHVSVTAGQLSTVDFAITCVSSTLGTVRITTATTGPDPDPDGYTAQVAWGPSITSTSMPVAGTVNVDVEARDPRFGRYLVSLLGVAANCSVESQGWIGPTRHVDVAAGATVAVAFAVTCEPMLIKRLPPGTQLAFVREGRIYRVNSDGTGEVRLTDGPSDFSPTWSPDGRRIAFVRGRDSDWDIHVMDADGSNVVRRSSGGYDFDPTWSPDGARIAFSSSSDVFVISADDDGRGATAVVRRFGVDAQPAWSPNGMVIAFASDWVAYDFASDIFLTNLDGSQLTQLTNGFWSLLQYRAPAWSPDGRKLAVVACPSQYVTCYSSAIALMNADGSGLTTLMSRRELHEPTWSPDGRTIAFSTAGIIGWISADGSERGIIVADGYSPAWRP
jgi:hypothetical protein